jgi:hypothetical protein
MQGSMCMCVLICCLRKVRYFLKQVHDRTHWEGGGGGRPGGGHRAGNEKRGQRRLDKVPTRVRMDVRRY